MQSGKDRGDFINKLPGDSLHSGEITGLGVDLMNKLLVSSSKDSSIKLWDFYRREL
jgi:WD40 repeat protein